MGRCPSMFWGQKGWFGPKWAFWPRNGRMRRYTARGSRPQSSPTFRLNVAARRIAEHFRVMVAYVSVRAFGCQTTECSWGSRVTNLPFLFGLSAQVMSLVTLFGTFRVPLGDPSCWPGLSKNRCCQLALQAMWLVVVCTVFHPFVESAVSWLAWLDSGVISVMTRLRHDGRWALPFISACPSAEFRATTLRLCDG